MSTKTTIKRIALVAVSALGFGLISAVPAAQAFPLNATVTTTNGTPTTASSDSLTAATVGVKFLTLAATDTATISFAINSAPTTWSSTGEAYLVYSALDTSTSVGGATTIAGGPTLTGGVGATDSVTASTKTTITGPAGGYAGVNFAVFLASTTGIKAGTYGVTYVLTPYEAGTDVKGTQITGTFNIVVSAAAADSLVADPVNSTAVMYQGSSFVSGNTVDSVVSVSATASNTARAVIRVVLKNASGNANAAMESITATIDKGSIGNGTTQGRSVVLAYTGTSLDLQIKSDGTAGQATVTIKSTSVTFANKVLTFYSTTVATMTATQLANTLKVGTNSSAIGVVAKDSNGNVVGSSTAVYAYSSATGVVSETATACTYSATYNQHFCDLTGVTAGTATVSFGTAGKTVVTPDFTVRVVGTTASTVAIAFDKATYQPGEVGYIIVSAKNADGYNVAGAVTNLLATGGITTNVALTNAGSGISTSDSMTSGTVSPTLAFSSTGYVSKEPVYAIKFFAPQTSGDMTLTATGGAALPLAAQVKVTATAKVANSAQVSADAALAAVTALATQVSAFITKINAQITTLTDLVMKIQKKVKA